MGEAQAVGGERQSQAAGQGLARLQKSYEMPLIIMTGYPCSGKTRRASELAAVFPKSILLNDESFDRNDIYSNASEEKKARAALLGAVERALTRETVVIADSLNYIKGYRYQLYCLARALSTPHLVVYCLASERQAHEWNHRYDPTVLAHLVSRYEEPNSQTRWDSPLVAVGPDEALPVKDIRAIIEGDARRPPSLATQASVPSSGCTANMDRVLQDTCELLAQAIRAGDQTCLIDGKRIEVNGMTSARLQRIRRHFAHMNRLNPVDGRERLQRLFIDYLSSTDLHL